MKTLKSRSQIHHQKPEEIFPEIIVAIRYNTIKGLFFSSATLYMIFMIVSAMQSGQNLNVIFFLTASFLLYKSTIFYIKANKFKNFTEYYVMRAFFQQVSYCLRTIGKQNVHAYTLFFTTKPIVSPTIDPIKNKIRNIPKQKSGTFFPTDNLNSVYRIIIDNDNFLLMNQLLEKPFFSPEYIGEQDFCMPVLNMNSKDNLHIEYLADGTILDFYYEDNTNQHQIHLSRSLKHKLLDAKWFTGLFFFIEIVLMGFATFQFLKSSYDSQFIYYELIFLVYFLMFCLFAYHASIFLINIIK
jgi:hypothetical protein